MNSKYCIYSHRRKEIEHKMFNIQILTAWHFLAHALNISHKKAHAAATLVLGCLGENWSRAFQATKIFQFPIFYWQREVKWQCDNSEDMTGTLQHDGGLQRAGCCRDIGGVQCTAARPGCCCWSAFECEMRGGNLTSYNSHSVWSLQSALTSLRHGPAPVLRDPAAAPVSAGAGVVKATGRGAGKI